MKTSFLTTTAKSAVYPNKKLPTSKLWHPCRWACNHDMIWYMICREWEDKHVHVHLYITFFCSGLGHQHSKGSNGSCYQSIYEPTEPSQAMMSDDDVGETKIDHNTGYVPYSFRIVCGFFNIPQSYMWTRYVRRELRFIVLIRED